MVSCAYRALTSFERAALRLRSLRERARPGAGGESAGAARYERQRAPEGARRAPALARPRGEGPAHPVQVSGWTVQAKAAQVSINLGGFAKRGRRRRTLPQSLLCSTIRAARLNDRVRDGNGCDPRAIDADQEHGVWGAEREPKAHGVGAGVLLCCCCKEDRAVQTKEGLAKPHGRLVPLG